MAGVQPYLIFPGTCEEAVKFYTSIFDGECLYTMRYKEAPMECPDNWKEKIIHTTFRMRGQEIMASDSFAGHEITKGDNVQLCVNFDKNANIDDMFNKLAEGGKVTQALNHTFWGAYFGMCVDKFGIHWMFSQHFEDKKK